MQRRCVAVDCHFIRDWRTIGQNARLVLQRLRIAPVKQRNIVIRFRASDASRKVAPTRCSQRPVVELDAAVTEQANFKRVGIVRAVFLDVIPTEQRRAFAYAVVRVASKADKV